MERYKVNFESIPWVTPTPGVRFKIHKQSGRQLRLVEFTDFYVEPEWCTKDHIGYVLEGQVQINFEGKVVVFGPGDGIFIPGGEEHKHMAGMLTELVRIILVEDA